jgi:hypothetical protein
MAGKITVSTINDSSGVLATQNGMTGIAKAWVFFNGATPTIVGQFNVSSITRNGTGDYTVNFTTAMADANYAIVCNAPQSPTASDSSTFATGLKLAGDATSSPELKTTTQVRILSRYQNANNTAQYDFAGQSVTILGS